MKLLASSIVALAFVACVAMAAEEEERIGKDVETVQRDGVVRHNIKLTNDKPQLVIIEFGKSASIKDKTKEDEKKSEDVSVEQRREQHKGKEQHDEKKSLYKIDDFAKQLLLSGRSSETFFAKRMIDFYEANPETKFQRQCFEENLHVGDESLDFVIDLDVSPSNDRVDKLLAKSPLASFVQQVDRTPSRAYFGAVEVFIESVTLELKPHLTHTVLLDKETKQKYFIRGRSADENLSRQSEFKDDKRRLTTLWPRPTKIVSESCIRHIVKNNLGHTTKMTLWNRNNGVPTVLAATRHTKPFYTIVVTDGSSGAKIKDLTDDLSRTTVIDIGNQRFLKSLSVDELRELGGSYFAFFSPHELIAASDFCRMMACRFAKEKR
jgi:hypothetical protein